MDRPLSGIKVLELSVFVAAPSCARLLADLGAEVIKVERPEGDNWRQVGKDFHPDHYSDTFNPVFDIYNSGKRFVSIEKRTANKAQMLRMVQDAFMEKSSAEWLRLAAQAEINDLYAAGAVHTQG